MQFKSGLVSSPSKKRGKRTGPRLRKKHKRLDAICEKEYTRNHGDFSEKGGSELRRSSRVRRTPDLLDASPSPPKKKRRIQKNVSLGVNNKSDRSLRNLSENPKDLVEIQEGSWGKRLRSRTRKVGFGLKGERGCIVERRRKLFEEKEVKDEEKLKKGGSESGKSRVLKSRRLWRTKVVTPPSMDGEKENRIVSNKDENEREEITVQESEGEESVEEEEVEREEKIATSEGNYDLGALILISEMDVDCEKKTVDDYLTVDGVDKGEKEMLPGMLHPDEAFIENQNLEIVNNVVAVEDGEKQVEAVEDGKKQPLEELECAEEDQNCTDDVEEADGNLTNRVTKNGGVCYDEKDDVEKDDDLAMLDKNSLEHENGSKVDKLNKDSTDMLKKPRIKEGRRCGLCGGASDGKPLKILQDMGESENEVCSGSSASEEPNYDIWDGFGDEPGWLGRLLGPINDRFGIAGIWVHQHCAVWSPEVYFAGLGCLKNVRAALCRGRALKCTRCGRPGATIGCRVDRCPRTYHLPCARANGCIFDHRKFLIACTDHRYIFQPHGTQYLAQIKKLKAKKMKLEMRKLSSDAWRRDMEAEEKWLENCGEDEEFLKRESKRLHRDLLRIAPIYIGGSGSEGEKLFQGWESVAGLQDVIRCMKEVVILPLLYPEFFDNLGITPPRGVLLHGYPGTGKTLVVRALIGACARGDKRIAYFARKGADCLGKYVGDAERQLRLLFQVAEKCQPSIIYFDEIDGLAPVRTRQQDQTHSSVVSTLLALLDGLKSRGSVVVIGATNRPDAVDPALRRPGRLDREIYFPLPSVEDRASILSLHTQKWPKPVSGPLLQWVARKTAGFAGADLQALCTQAAIIALKRSFPLQEILSASGERDSGNRRPPLPEIAVEERDWLEALSCAPPPCSRREAGMAANDVACSPLPCHLVPCLLKPLSILLVSLYLDERVCLPHTLFKAAIMIKNVMVSALDKKKIGNDCWWAHVDDFVQEAEIANEIEKKLCCSGILVGDNSFASSDGINLCIDAGVKFKPPIGRTSFALRNKSGFRILIAGDPRSGQRHLAACLLHCFVGNVEIQKVDLASISQEGHGNVVQGITQILMKCAGVQSCIVFMPRIDLWAVEAHREVTEESDTCSEDNQSPEKEESRVKHGQIDDKENANGSEQNESTEMAGVKGAGHYASPSHAWCSFVEQVESLSMSTSLMILATSELPFLVLPQRVRQFFRSDISICSQSTPLEHTVPRFSMQTDGNFNRDMVINLSAAELSRDVVQSLVQLFHQKSHINTITCNEYRVDSSELEDKAKSADKSSTRVPLLSSNRNMRGKSSLLLAISTFGYQILLYPHFAELCWVTSKLKEGPSADISGPWKGWPFNSCVIRPTSSQEKVELGSFSNVKTKERSGLVRGLVAVGLLAYRGVYTSLREVSIEVRKVLDLLVGQINLKVHAGKDRYQYVRILSQVAFLEDMVNNWAYTLQSLEQDASSIVPKNKLNGVESQDVDHASDNSQVRSNEFDPNVATKSFNLPETLDTSPKASTDDKVEHVNLTKGDEKNSSLSYSGSKIEILGSNQQKSVLFGNFSLETAHPNYAEPNAENSGTLQLNGIVSTDSVVISDSDPSSSCELAGDKFSGLSSNTGKFNVANPGNNEENADSSSASGKDGVSSSSGIVCSVSCCPVCVRILHGLMKKILICEFGLDRNDWTAEDVHDVVASLSVDLLAAVRKLISGNPSSLSDENPRQQGNYEKLFKYLDLESCLCRSSRNMAGMPMECACHSVTKLSENANTSPWSQLGSDLKFIFRDGVLVNIDPDKDVFLHCRFETLCLCSLIDLIVMAKNPF